MKSFLGFLLLLPGRAWGGTTVTGDQQTTGQMGVGTQVPQARLEARQAASDEHALKVSSQNGAGLLWVQKDGKVGAGVASPQASLDLAGSGDDGTVGLLLRVGNSSQSFSSAQLVFASTEGLHRHSLRTRANPSGLAGNALDFYLFRSTGAPEALGDLRVLSLEAGVAASSGSMHVLPFGQADVELEVSDGLGTGQGTLLRAAAAQHSARRLKWDIRTMGRADAKVAYEDVKALRPAEFRYRRSPGAPRAPLRRGLIYEDAPASVRGAGETVVLDERLLNLELALKAAHRRIGELRGRVEAAEREGR